jgi:hypothetical protein
MFHCALGAKAVSLCADMHGEHVIALACRYGVPARVERSCVARSGGDRRFAATVAALAPGASVRQAWSTRRDFS